MTGLARVESDAVTEGGVAIYRLFVGEVPVRILSGAGPARTQLELLAERINEQIVTHNRAAFRIVPPAAAPLRENADAPSDEAERIVRLADRRPPTVYELQVHHHWNKSIQVWTRGIAIAGGTRSAARRTRLSAKQAARLWASRSARAMWSSSIAPTATVPDRALDAGRRSPKRDGQSYVFAEEIEPCGVTGLSLLTSRYGSPAVDTADMLVARPRPWILTIWEPLPTKAPGPHLAQPYCCYVRRVIFYYRPYLVGWPRGWRDRHGVFRREATGGFIEWDQVETRLIWEDVVEFQGERFTIGGGTVVWRKRSWWMLRSARRVTEPGAAGTIRNARNRSGVYDARRS